MSNKTIELLRAIIIKKENWWVYLTNYERHLIIYGYEKEVLWTDVKKS